MWGGALSFVWFVFCGAVFAVVAVPSLGGLFMASVVLGAQPAKAAPWRSSAVVALGLGVAHFLRAYQVRAGVRWASSAHLSSGAMRAVALTSVAALLVAYLALRSDARERLARVSVHVVILLSVATLSWLWLCHNLAWQLCFAPVPTALGAFLACWTLAEWTRRAVARVVGHSPWGWALVVVMGAVGLGLAEETQSLSASDSEVAHCGRMAWYHLFVD